MRSMVGWNMKSLQLVRAFDLDNCYLFYDIFYVYFMYIYVF